MTKKIELTEEKPLSVEGLMTIQLKDDGLHTADFQCCEDVQTEPFIGTFRVQAMRDGNVYMDEKPKRIRNKPKFREDNSSFSIGRNHQVYYIFTMPEALMEEVPEQLVRQASAIAQKIVKELICKKGVKA